MSGLLFNALEPTVEVLYPALRHVKETLRRVGLARPMISGSGSTVFSLCGSKEEAVAAAQVLERQQPGWRLYVAGTKG